MANINPKMFVNFTGSKATFISKGYSTTYANSIVFISGDANGATAEDKSSCIFAKGKYFANAVEAEKYLATIPYFKGIRINGTDYNAANGGGYLGLAASDPATITLTTGNSGVEIGLTDTVKNTIGSAVQSVKGDSKYISASKTGTEITVSANVETDLATSASDNSLPTAKAAKDYINSKIDALEVPDTAVAGQYVSEVSESNGKIAVVRADLPTYTLVPGDADGQVKFNDKNIDVTGLKSAAFVETSTFATAAQGVKANTALQDITAGDYISKTGTGTTRTITAKVKKVSESTAAKQGFADAYDVKTELGTLSESISGVNDRAVTALNQLTVWTGKNNENYADDETKSIRNISAEEVAKIVAGADENYDTLVEIANWIKSDTTGAAKMAADIETNKTGIETNKTAINNIGKNLGEPNAITGTVYAQLTALRSDVNALGGEEGGIADQINAALDKLDLTDAEVAGEYVTAVAQNNGQISVARKALPTYTLETGATSGTVKFNGTEVAVKGLGTAAYTASTAYATSTQGGYANSALQSVSVASGSTKYAEFGNKTGNNGSKTQNLSIKTIQIAAASSTSTGLADAYNVQTFVGNSIDNALAWEELS